MDKKLVIAIDGPSGSGKSTVAREVSNRLNILYVDTGAMYRSIGLACEENNVAFQEGEALESFLKNLKMEYGLPEGQLIAINGEDYSQKIRQHHVSGLASQISQLPIVRNFLVDFQRNLAKERFCVMEGRDIGTVVFPDAFLKVYLTANVEVRAKRRLDELKERGEDSHQLEEIIRDVEERDKTDMAREMSPLRQADDAKLLDSSKLSPEDVLKTIVDWAKEEALKIGRQL